MINTAGTTVAGRFGPDQSGVIHAQPWASGPSTGGITLTFVMGTGRDVAVRETRESGPRLRGAWPHAGRRPGRQRAGLPVDGGQRGHPPVRQRRQRHEVPRDARLHAHLAGQTRRGGSDERLPEDVHGLRAAIRERRAGPRRTAASSRRAWAPPTRRGRWTTPRSSPAAGTSSALQIWRSASNCSPWLSGTQITVAAGFRSLDARHVAGGRAPEEALARLRLHRQRRVGLHDLQHRGHRRREPEGRRRVGSDRGSGRTMQIHGLLGGL